MGSQASQHSETPLTHRQIAARKRAARLKEINAAAKAWLATRKDSPTPAADCLIARHIGKGWDEASARQELLECLTNLEWDTFQDDYVRRPLFADGVVYNLLQRRFISNRNYGNYVKAIALMQEAGIPADYWEGEADRRAQEQAQVNRATPAPVQAPLIEADEPATARIECEIKPRNAPAEPGPDEPPPSAPVSAQALEQAWAAYHAAYDAGRAILKERNPRLRAISRKRGFLSEIGHAEKAKVMAEYAEQLAQYSAQARRACNALIRMGHPPHPYAEIQDEDLPEVSQIDSTENVALPVGQRRLQVTTHKGTDKARKQNGIDFLQSDVIQPQPAFRRSQMPHTYRNQQYQTYACAAHCPDNSPMNGLFDSFTPLLIKEIFFFPGIFIRCSASAGFQNNTPQFVAIHAVLLLPFCQLFVIAGNIGRSQHVITQQFTPFVMPFLIPRCTGPMGQGAQGQATQMAVDLPHAIQYLTNAPVAHRWDKQLALISGYRFLLSNRIASVVFKVTINRRNDRPVLPRLHIFTNQRLVIQAQRPTMGNVNQLNQLHWGDRPSFRLSFADKVVGNSQRRLRLHSAIPVIKSLYYQANTPITASTALLAA